MLKVGINYAAKYYYDKAHELIEKHNIVFKERPKKEKPKKKDNPKPLKFCQVCGKQLTGRQQIYCSQECSHKAQEKSPRPPREEFKKLIRTKSFLEIGRRFNVSDNAIRKWCDKYDLPRRKKDINNYSDEEWELV